METIRALIKIFRPSRWYRNSFMLLGAFLSLLLNNIDFFAVVLSIGIAFVATCCIAFGNYGVNEIMDADSDKHHPQKSFRSIASGKVGKRTVSLISIVLYCAGFALGMALHNTLVLFFLFLLFVSGVLYNIPPRLKDLPYVDFIAEAFNNPLRLWIGWYSVSFVIAPISLMFLFWFLGIFIMAAKRFAEIRFLDADVKGLYRKSLNYYTEKNLLFSMIGASSAFMYMLGIVTIKYRIHLTLMLPFLIIFILWFFALSYEKNSIVKDPERIWEQKPFLLYSLFILILFLGIIRYSGSS